MFIGSCIRFVLLWEPMGQSQWKAEVVVPFHTWF